MKQNQSTFDFDPPSRPVDTSTAAAQRVMRTGKARQDRANIYALIKARGAYGLTQKEACAFLGYLTRQSACARFWELEGGRRLAGGTRERPPLIRRIRTVRDDCRAYVALDLR